MELLKEVNRHLCVFILIFSTVAAESLESKISMKTVNSTATKICWILPSLEKNATLQIVVDNLDSEGNTQTQVKKLLPQNSSCTVESSLPGEMYKVSLRAIENEQKRVRNFTKLFVIKPSPPMNLEISDTTETSTWVNYEPPSGVFSHYLVLLSPPNNNNASSFNFRQTRMRFDDLQPATAYHISVQTVSHNVTSNPAESEFSTLPRLSDLTSEFCVKFNNSSTPNSFLMSWDPPSSYDFENFELVLTAPQFYQKNLINKEITQWEVHDLSFKTKYQLVFKKIPHRKNQQLIRADLTFFQDHFYVDSNGISSVVSTL